MEERLTNTVDTPLILPVCAGEELVEEIRRTHTDERSLAVWWLGQSGYAFKWEEDVVYVDLYLSEHLTAKYAATDKPHIRMTESPLRGNQIADAGLVLSSHKHSDHLDPGTLPDLFQSSSEARLLLPRSLADHAVSMGLQRDRLILADAHEEIEWRGIRIRPLPSAHEGLDWTSEGGYPYLGFLIRFGPITVYHSGDTVPYEGLHDALRESHPHITFVPINGRDARRKTLGVPGNMTIEEAVELAEAVQPDVIVPHHYDMFTFNTADVKEFERALQRRLPEQKYRILKCGERWVYSI